MQGKLIRSFFSRLNLIFIFISISGISVSQAVLIINNEYPKNSKMGIYRIDEPVVRKEIPVKELTTGKTDTISIVLASGRNAEMFVLRNDESWREVYLRDGDTLKVSYFFPQHEWEIRGGNAEKFNNSFSNIDEGINNFFRNSYIHFPTASRAKQTNYFTDTLRKSFVDTCGEFLRDYLFYKTAGVEITGNSRSRSEIIRRYYQKTPAPNNPAWTEAFNELFTGYLRQQLNKKNGDSLKAIFSKGNSVFELIDVLGRDTLLKQPELLKLVAVKGIYELGQTKEFNRTKLIGFLKELDSEKEFPSVRKSAATIITMWERFSKGKQVENFTYESSSQKQFNALRGKPVYLCYYPVFNQDTQQELLMLKGLNNKFKKEMHFLAIINVSTETGFRAALLNLEPGFEVAALSSCSAEFEALLENKTSRNYMLIDKAGKIWQAPAEGPETGVEAAFLQLIKAN